jgi:nucleoside-diphosphate-sugar epimerase
MQETMVDALAAYRSVNVAGTQRLAEQSAALGVRRLVFLSSIGVLGIHTNGRGPFICSDEPSPVEDYAISKWEAELALQSVVDRTDLAAVIVRPPLVYGPGVKGNFARLLGLISRGLPLPLGAMNNRRSLIGLDNLVDLLVRCIEHPRATGQTFLVSDGEDLSTSELLRRMAVAMCKPAHLFSLPVSWLRVAGRMGGKLAEVERLLSSLQIDSSHTRDVLDWTPPVSLNDGLKATTEWYLKQNDQTM